LEHEAALASRLHHPNIARVHGVHEVQGELYVVTEYVEGCSLDTLLTFALMREQSYSAAFTLYVGAAIASALDHAHTLRDEQGEPLGIVHRDVTTSHVRMDPRGRVKLCDFGLASSRLQQQRATPLWRAGGDVFYASPEQLQGDPVDARSDLFCLGLILLELATGRYLFAESNVGPREVKATLARLSPADRARLCAIVTNELPACSEYVVARAMSLTPGDVESAVQWLPAPLKIILHKLLCRDPADRYQTAGALEDTLRTELAVSAGTYGAPDAMGEVLFAQGAALRSQQPVEITEAMTVLPPNPVPSAGETTTE
jgi:serine/threonine-protein kinase